MSMSRKRRRTAGPDFTSDKSSGENITEFTCPISSPALSGRQAVDLQQLLAVGIQADLHACACRRGAAASARM